MKPGGLGETHSVILNSNESKYSSWTIAHEFAHSWDGVNNWNLSRSMKRNLEAGFDHPIRHMLNPKDPSYWYDPGKGPPPCGIDGSFNRKEDFAEAVTAYIFPLIASANASERGWPYADSIRGYEYSSYFDTPRGQFINALLFFVR